MKLVMLGCAVVLCGGVAVTGSNSGAKVSVNSHSSPATAWIDVHVRRSAS
jgi:hypothetical protein